MYVGSVNVSTSGPCLKWTEVDHEFVNSSGIGDHNYCRNPDRNMFKQEICITDNETVPCDVRTCGNYNVIFLILMLCMFLDPVSITGYSNKNGKRVAHNIEPIKENIYTRRHGKCSTFDLQTQFPEVKIESPVPATAIIHARRQFYSMELASMYIPLRHHKYFDIIISETLDLATDDRPCYAGRNKQLLIKHTLLNFQSYLFLVTHLSH